MNRLQTFDPSTLLGDRLGLSLYVAFVQAYLSGSYEREAALYRKFLDHFPGERKIHSVEKFTALIDTIAREGFDTRYPVSGNPREHILRDGSHRCAVAIQLGQTEIPYSLRFEDDRVDDTAFREIFSEEEVAWLESRQQEFIARCDAVVGLRCRLRKHMHAHPDSFRAPFSSVTRIPALRTYQGFEPLGILGKRPSVERLESYQLVQFLPQGSRVLEAGCNVGFFSLALSKHVAAIEGFEVDSNYVDVARLVAEFCKADCCQFRVGDVRSYPDDARFDLVISTAVHGWAGLPFGEYVERIERWVAPRGLVLFESHEIDAERDWPDKRFHLAERFEVVAEGLIDGVDHRIYESEIREFLILRKR
jgi:SAM-dependent methyltransferase